MESVLRQTTSTHVNAQKDTGLFTVLAKTQFIFNQNLNAYAKIVVIRLHQCSKEGSAVSKTLYNSGVTLYT